MTARILLLVWSLLATVGVLGWWSSGQLTSQMQIDALAVALALACLWFVLKLPWDLYFQARAVQSTQLDGVERELDITESDVDEAGSIARRMLAIALTLHLLGALVAFSVGPWVGVSVGPVLSAAFLLSMGLRPVVAMIRHVRARLSTLSTRAKIPVSDAREIRKRLDKLRYTARMNETALKTLTERTELFESNTTVMIAEQASRLHEAERQRKLDLERIGDEFERSIGKLTRDQEVLHGIRAFLKLVKES